MTRWARFLTLAKTEGMLFKIRLGTGSNLSSLRSSREATSMVAGTGVGPGLLHARLRRFAGANSRAAARPPRPPQMVILHVDFHPRHLDLSMQGRIERRGGGR